MRVLMLASKTRGPQPSRQSSRSGMRTGSSSWKSAARRREKSGMPAWRNSPRDVPPHTNRLRPTWWERQPAKQDRRSVSACIKRRRAPPDRRVVRQLLVLALVRLHRQSPCRPRRQRRHRAQAHQARAHQQARVHQQARPRRRIRCPITCRRLLDTVYEEYEDGDLPTTAQPGQVEIQGTNVGVQLTTSNSSDFAAMLSAAESLGLQVTTSSATYNTVVGFLPIAELPAAAQLTGAPSITPLQSPELNLS